MPRGIVFINQATGYITIDIINSFANHFDDISLIAGSIRVQDINLSKKVHWSKIIPYNRGNPLKKFISWIIGTIQIFFLLMGKYRNHEVFYVTIPPSAYLLSLILSNKFSILVFDVYPDVLKIYKYNESSLIYRLWAHWNRKLFSKAHRIFTIGEGMAELLSSYIPKDHLKILPLWTGLTTARRIPKSDNIWLAKQEFKNKFIVQYSGNIGYTHNVEILIELAIHLRMKTEIHFLIIGRGKRYNLICNQIEEHALKNCTVMPYQPDDFLIYSLAAADIGVVLLDEKTAHVSLPSKIYNLQAVSIPILGISPPGSELDIHLKEYKNGRCFQQSDIGGMIDFILNMKNNPEELRYFSENSIKAANFFSRANADKFYKSYDL